MQKTLALCVNWASGQCANHLGCDACTEAVSERSRNGLGTGSETGPLARPREGFARFELRGRRNTFARSSIDFVAGASLSQGQVSISWQAQHFRKVKCQIRGTRSSFARSSTKLWQAHHFRKVKYRICGRCSTFARSSAKFVARAVLSQGQVQILWQAQHFSKVKHRFGGRRSIFARSTFAAGARKSQLLSTKVVREVNFRSWGLKIATFKYESSAQSPLSQPGLENRNF